jgi:hypothetical protein
MQGSPREKVGEGAYADVHAWAPGQVVKLFKASVPRRPSWRMTRAVFAAGGPAPEVFDEVAVEGASAWCSAASTDRPCCSSRAAAP